MNKNKYNLKTDRLKQIADFVGRDISIADIGTDHGYLPIYLVENNLANYAILADVNIGPLKIAWKNLAAINDLDEILSLNTRLGNYEFRLGDGLEPINNNEVDVITIAGMGGELMVDILDRDVTKSNSFSKYIFQPRTNSAILRKWLYDNDWSPILESIAEEKGRLCEIIVATPNTKSLSGDDVNKNATKYLGEDNMEFEVSSVLLRDAPPLLKDFIDGKIDTEQKILKGLLKSTDSNVMGKIADTEKRISILKEKLR